jgi:hypothetical protein
MTENLAPYERILKKPDEAPVRHIWRIKATYRNQVLLDELFSTSNAKIPDTYAVLRHLADMGKGLEPGKGAAGFARVVGTKVTVTPADIIPLEL